jgi:hypothetical protein
LRHRRPASRTTSSESNPKATALELQHIERKAEVGEKWIAIGPKWDSGHILKRLKLIAL